VKSQGRRVLDLKIAAHTSSFKPNRGRRSILRWIPIEQTPRRHDACVCVRQTHATARAGASRSPRAMDTHRAREPGTRAG
jgi:hypothetical protein